MSTTAFRRCDADPYLKQYRSFSRFWDFDWYTTATDGSTTVSATSGTTAISADSGKQHGGYLKLLTAATSSDNQSVRTTNPIWLFQTGSSGYIEAFVNFTNVTSDNAAIFFGFTSNTAAELISGGLKSTTSYTGAGIYKEKSTNVWGLQGSNATTKTFQTSVNTAVDGSYLLRLDFVDHDGSNTIVTATVNGKPLVDSNNLPIAVVVSKTSAAIMYGQLTVQAGSGSAQALYCDYLSAGGLHQTLSSVSF